MPFKDREKRKEYIKQWRLANKERVDKNRKEYYLDNKERLDEWRKQYNKEWYLKNKKIRLKYWREHYKMRYNSDPLYKLKRNLRSRTRNAFKKKSWIKEGGTEKLLGCDWETAMKHIESQFESWMNWDNHGEWHIDHIIPLASATTKEEMTNLCHYTNLQPLSAEENINKGDKILI
jgi:hypothetical protein